MEKNTIAVRVDSRDLVNSKFINTISTVEGYLKEAKGDLEVGQNYSANAVYRRMAKIREVLAADLENLSRDIEPVQSS